MNMETTAHTLCASCVQSYQGADINLRCRINGLKASKANADDCKRYEREAGSDDWLTIPLCVHGKHVMNLLVGKFADEVEK